MFFIKNGIEGYSKVFCYKGIVGRKAFFYWIIFQTLILGITGLVSFYLYALLKTHPNTVTNEKHAILAAIGLFVAAIVAAYSWLAGIAISTRRLHDIGLSGWLQLLPIVVALLVELLGSNGGYGIHLIFALILLLVKTKEENNKYRPKQQSIPCAN